MSVQLSSDFDSQNIATWKWTATQHMLPVRDVFYPYGNLFYYQYNSSLAGVTLLLLTTGTVAIIVLTLWRFKSTWLTGFAAASLFLLFLVRTVGLETWSRYGLIVALVVLLPDLVQRKRWYDYVLMGMFVGGMFGLVQDQSVYMAVLFLTALLVQGIAREGKSLLYTIKSKFVPGGLFIIGSCVGVIPFVVYLISIHGVSAFLSQGAYLRSVTLFAKAPFIPFALSPSNACTFLTLFAAMMFLSHKVILQRKVISSKEMMMGMLCGLILILEQKSIIRSIDWQIVVVAWVIVLFGSDDVWRALTRRTGVSSMIVWILLFCLILLYPFRRIPQASTTSQSLIHEYQTLLENLKTYPDYNGKVFSYPGDPIFYKLTAQTPPYYFTSYESSPESAQQRIIKYLQDQDIQYVVYNLDRPAIQDAVPNFIRNPVEHAYLLSNFEAVSKQGKFLILYKSNHVSLGKICQIAPDSALCSWLHDIDLKMVPTAFGKDERSTLFKPTSLDSLNRKLAQHPVSTRNMSLVFHVVGENALYQRTVSLWVSDVEKINVRFNACAVCVIPLNMLPGLYIPTRIQHIDISDLDVRDVQFHDMIDPTSE